MKRIGSLVNRTRRQRYMSTTKLNVYHGVDGVYSNIRRAEWLCWEGNCQVRHSKQLIEALGGAPSNFFSTFQCHSPAVHQSNWCAETHFCHSFVHPVLS